MILKFISIELSNTSLYRPIFEFLVLKVQNTYLIFLFFDTTASCYHRFIGSPAQRKRINAMGLVNDLFICWIKYYLFLTYQKF